MVRFKSDLLLNLDLTFTSKSGIFRQQKNNLFDQDLSFNAIEKTRLNKVLLVEKGYLSNFDNFLTVNPEQLSYPTKSVTLRNSRVILFWRNVDIDFLSIQRIISLGLGVLMGAISKDECAFYTKQIVENRNIEVAITVKHREDTFVLIGLEGPLFTR
jgi:hypothetical protein